MTALTENRFAKELTLRISLIAAFVVLVCMRLPNVIHQGRFWAEEGVVFYMNARKMPWLEATFNSYAGYTNLAANLAGVLAYHLAPLKSAPYISTAFACLIQTFPAILFCMSSAPWLKNWRTLAVALLIVLVQPASQEIWLSSIGSQCFLNLCVGLILALPVERSHWKRWLQYLLLLFAPLSGPGGSFLLPFMAARAWIDKSKLRAFQAIVLFAGTLVQLLFFFHKSDRSMTAEWPLFLNAMFLKHLVVPFLGRTESVDIAAPLSQAAHQGAGELPLWPAYSVISYFLIVAFIAYRERAYAAFWPLMSAAFMTPLAFFGALGDRRGLLDIDGGNRYTYAPQVLLELSLLMILCTGKRDKWKFLVKWILAWLVIIGMHEYFYSSTIFSQGTEWRSEVRKWQADPTHELEVWPSGWRLKISR